MKTMDHHVPSFDETPLVRFIPVPETPTIPSVGKRWRSDVLHPVAETPRIPSVSKRWRSGYTCISRILYRTTPQLRWRAGVLACFASHFEDSETHNQIPRNV